MPDQSQRFVIEVDDAQLEASEKRAQASFERTGRSGKENYEKVGGSVNSMNAVLLRGVDAANRFAGSHQHLTNAVTTTTAAVLNHHARLFALKEIYGTVRASALDAAAGLRTAAAAAEGFAIPALAIAGTALLARRALELSYAYGEAAEKQLLLSDRTGISATRIQELAGASLIAGGQAQDLLTVAVSLDKTLEKLGENKRALRALDELGISAKDSFGHLKSGSDLLPEIADNFDRLTDPVQRARVGIGLFGGEFEKVLPQLNSQLSENVNQLNLWGAVLSEKTTRDVAEFKRDIDALTGSLRENAGEFNAAKEGAKAFVVRGTVAAYKGTKDFLSNDPFLGSPIFDREAAKTAAELETIPSVPT